MIARVLYRKSVQGVLKYVLGKEESTILGFQNTYSDTDTDMEFFGRVLHHLGNRHDSEKRYAHISLNLPRGENLSDRDFFELSKNYMEHMGYGGQPYVIIRHHDTKHEHVHIVSSTIKEDCLQINLSNDIRRSIATQKYLEKEFGLSPSPETKNTKELPVYEMPEFRIRDINGVRFYIQDIVNIVLQKYKVRSFDDLARHLKNHHIELRTVERNGRVGVSYGVAVKDGYRSRFINGYTVHPQLSGPKLQKVFEQNQSSELLPMVKKRLEKQLQTTYGFFRTINPEHLPDILQSHQKLDCKVEYDEDDNPMDFTIYDKSGYVLKSEEIANDLGILQNPELFNSEFTQMYAESVQLQLELQRCIKEAYKCTYQSSGSKTLFSEHIDNVPIRAIVAEMAKSERFKFLKKYLHTDNQKLGKLIKRQFDIVKDKLYISESLREEQQIKGKAELIKQAIGKGVFDAPKQQGVLFELVHSLGTKYNKGILSYSNSYRHQVKLDLGHVQLPKQIDFYASPYFVKENEKVLDGFLNSKTEKEIGLSPNAIFLPLMFPNLYDAMTVPYREKFERLSLRTYHKYAERMQVSFEKSPNDYMEFFNEKGFYFVKGENGFEVKSIYTDYGTSSLLPKRTSLYLNTIPNLNETLKEQQAVIGNLIKEGRNNLKNLWAGHLMEKGLYERVAFILTVENVHPNLHRDIARHHMDNGLRKTIQVAMARKSSIQQNHMLRKSVYAVSSLLGDRGKKHDEVFNGFKDELTDWSKYKGKEISF